jgi:4'-phosphopantetheinyl transferase
MTNDQNVDLTKICNQYLSDITWLNAATSDFLISNTIDVWRIKVSSNLSLLDSFLAIMQPGEIARANRYFKTDDKSRFIISRGALRNILGTYLNQLPQAIEFGQGTNKKPFVKNTGNTELHYNISHSGDWILLAISNSEVGVDTEFVNQSFAYKEVIQENFSTDEIGYINEKLSTERFFMLWTRKEALTKATGKGLDDDLKLIPCLDGIHFSQSNVMAPAANWLVSSFELHEQYIASIAHNVTTTKIKFWDVCF